MPTRRATERTLAPRLAPRIVTTVTLACSSPSRTGPHEMSAAAHEAAAAREELAADVERSRYDPDAWHGWDCRGVRLGERQRVCWSEPRNPTARHLDDSRRRRELADRHRAAPLALREAETAACAELAAADRDGSRSALSAMVVLPAAFIWETTIPCAAAARAALSAAGPTHSAASCESA